MDASSGIPIYRRLVQRIASLILACSPLALVALAPNSGICQQTARAPNIVLIVADDLGWGDLGCYGHPRHKTPQLDRLAADGARLTRFNTPAPFCAPTRAALLTGRYPARCRLMANPTPDAGKEADGRHLPESETLLPQLLRQAGYATCMVGKWHLGHRRTEWWPTRRGFDEYLGILYSNDMRPVQRVDGEKVVEYPLVQATLTERYTQRAIAFIQRNHERPFFLYLAHAMPHKPLACSESFYRQSGCGLYGDVIAELDSCIGRVLATLDELKLAENTLVIFTSDNGPWYGGSTGGLRGMKGTSWEGGCRVPCLVRWRGKVRSGTVCDTLAVTMDLFTTTLAAADVKLPGDLVIDGRNLLPALSANAPSLHDVILGQQGSRLATIQDSRWKLHVLPQATPAEPRPDEEARDPRAPDGVTILAPYEQATRREYPGVRSGDETGAMSLFDLERDPGEQHDVAREHPDVVALLRARFEEMARELALRQTEPPAK